jgi:site-specific recombinase XerD
MGKVNLTAKVGNCSVSLGLDRRKAYADGYRVSMKYVMGGRTYYYPLSWRATDEEFERIQGTSTTRGRMSQEKKSLASMNAQWEETFAAYKERLENLAKMTTLSLDVIRASLTGMSLDACFLSVWREVIASRKHGTGASYEIAMKSFVRITGFAERDGFAVTKDTIHKWVQGLTDEGKAKATIGIYLRACRVVVNECIRRGFLLQSAYPFSEKDISKVSIPRGKSRKQECLSVEQWTQLYDIFSSQQYPEEWTDEYKKATHIYLGMFLAMYLMNGLNLADLARLTYNKHYTRSGKKCLQFYRQKTKDRTDNDAEVIVPITEPLRVILSELAAEYEPDGLLFPYLLKDATTDAEKARRVQQENQNCKKHVRKLTATLGWTEQPSPTWCRHSFATNLQQRGVPMKYISDAMGHSTGGSVTMGYINDYPLDRQLEYNNKLLNLKTNDDKLNIGNHSDEKRAELINDIIGRLSDEQRAELINDIIGRLSDAERAELIKMLLKK